MVQELSYSDNCAMFPSRQSYNTMFGYPQQSGYQDSYGAFNVEQSLQQPGSCSWPNGMYTATTSGGRATSAGLEDWTAQFAGVGVPATQGAGNQSPTGSYSYIQRGGVSMSGSDYAGSPNNMNSINSMALSNSPSPTGIAYNQGNTPSANSVVNRQTSRAPYDWMKKQTYPTTPTTGNSQKRMLQSHHHNHCCQI